MVTSKVWTYADLDQTPDDGRRYEILDGVLHVTASPGRKHQRCVGALYSLLVEFDRAGLGEVYLAPFDVVFADTSVTEPDLLFVSAERLDIITDQNVQGAPDLVVEVLSPNTARVDLNAKLRVYERFGVRYYWIVDPLAQQLIPFERGPTGFVRGATLEPGDVLTCPLFPGHALPVASIFA